MTFARAFGRHVVPTLVRMCSTEGLLIALGLSHFGESEGRIIAHAGNRGAYRLTDAQFSDLEDMIGQELLQAALGFEPTAAAGIERGRRLQKALGHG